MILVLRSLLIVTLMLISVNVVGQSRIANDSSSMDEFWRKYIVNLQRSLSLEDMKSNNKNNFFRIWIDKVVVEIWYENEAVNGRLTHWVMEVVPNSEEDTDRYFVIKDDLNSAECINIMSLIDKYSIRKMPSSQYIAGWKNGLDGVEYIIEDRISNLYNFKNYWTPSIQKNVYEADVVENFVNELLTVIDEKERYRYFSTSIPFHSWTNDGAMVTTKITSYGESTRMKQERNRYRKTKKQQL